jgi:hypothetical protein
MMDSGLWITKTRYDDRGLAWPEWVRIYAKHRPAFFQYMMKAIAYGAVSTRATNWNN